MMRQPWPSSHSRRLRSWRPLLLVAAGDAPPSYSMISLRRAVAEIEASLPFAVLVADDQVDDRLGKPARARSASAAASPSASRRPRGRAGRRRARRAPLPSQSLASLSTSSSGVIRPAPDQRIAEDHHLDQIGAATAAICSEHRARCRQSASRAARPARKLASAREQRCLLRMDRVAPGSGTQMWVVPGHRAAPRPRATGPPCDGWRTSRRGAIISAAAGPLQDGDRPLPPGGRRLGRVAGTCGPPQLPVGEAAA